MARNGQIPKSCVVQGPATASRGGFTATASTSGWPNADRSSRVLTACNNWNRTRPHGEFVYASQKSLTACLEAISAFRLITDISPIALATPADCERFPGAALSLWMWARRAEVASLRWDDLHVVGKERHFDFIGKWGIRKWARIPAGLYRELAEVRTDRPYVFAAYTDQLREHYRRTPHPLTAKIVGSEFDPELLYRWFHAKIRKWAEVTGRERASHHAFRKTALQTASRGDDRNVQVAQDAKITEAVMLLRHYVDETDDEFRQASNRTYARLLAGLNPKVAERYGYRAEEEGASLEDRLAAAVNAKDSPLAKELLDRLSA